MQKIEVANFIRSEPLLAATVVFDERGKKPQIIGRSGYIADRVWDRLAIQAARKLLIKH